jgi:predicted metal-dependent hydrolase
MTSMKQILNYGARTIEYDVITSKRVKTSEIIVDEDKIVVRTPMNKSLEESKKMVERKASWILKKQLEYKNRGDKVDIIAPTFENNSSLAYLGKNIKLRIYYTAPHTEFELKDNQFYAFLKGDMKHLHPDHRIRSMYEGWIKKQSTKILGSKVLSFSVIIDVKPKKTIFKNLKNRWGSAAKDETLNLNINLAKAPVDVIDYIIIHELCHLRIKEHSHRFWNLVKQYCPDYDRKIEWLETNGKHLLI